MKGIFEQFFYRAFGLNIASTIPLPELIEIDNKAIDITINESNLLPLWSKLADPDKYFVVKSGLCLFRVPGIAIFRVQNGNEVTFCRLKEAVIPCQLNLYLLGSCMGALLMQRKVLPLHGSAVEIEGKAYAIVGDSGAGKSTLASAFINKGFKLLSDDVIPISINGQGVPIVTSAYPQQKLWKESLNYFGMDTDGLQPIVDREEKFTIPILNDFVDASLPLGGVIELTINEDKRIQFHSIYSLDRVYMLFRHTYRNFIINRSDLMQWHFDITTKIAAQTNSFYLQRPKDYRFTASELTEIILAAIKKEEKVYD